MRLLQVSIAKALKVMARKLIGSIKLVSNASPVL